MKRFLCITLALLMVLSLAACGGDRNGETATPGAPDTEQDSPKTVTMFTKKREWNWEEIEKKFEDANPGYDLIVETCDADNYDNILKSYAATQDFPDVIQTTSGSSLDLWKEHLVDVGDLACLEKMQKDIVNEFYLDGVCYGVPLFAEYHGVIYNMTYLKAAGIEEPPETLSEFIAMNQALQAAGQPTGIAPWKGAAVIPAHMAAPVFAAQEDALAYYQQIEDGQADLTQDEMFNALLDYLDAVREYGNEDALNTDNTTERNAMYAGDYAWYAHDGSWVTPALRSTNPDMEQNLRLGVYPFSDDAALNKVGVSVQSLSIMNTENIEAAKVFVEWLLGTDEGCDILAKENNVVMQRTDYVMAAEDIGELAAQGVELTNAGKGASNFRWISGAVMVSAADTFQKYIAGVYDRDTALNEIASIIQANKA